MIKFALAIACLAPLAAFAAPAADHIGDLTFDASRWEARQDGDGFDVVCRSRNCDAGISVTIAPRGAARCDEGTLKTLAGPERDPVFKTVHRPGFDVHVVSAWTGCRNARPPSVHACTIYRDRIYRIESPVIGCSGGPGFSDGTLEFLESLSGG